MALVVLPRHPEDDLAFGFADTFDQGIIGIIGALCDDAAEAFQHFAHGLVKLGFGRVAPEHLGHDGFQFFIQLCHAASCYAGVFSRCLYT
jgi:hypothetical protein